MRASRIRTDDTDDYFTFERDRNEGGGTYTFVPMTLKIYNEKVKSRLFAKKDFINEEEMLKAFEETIKDAW